MPPIRLSQLLIDMMDRDAADLYLAVDAPPRFSLHGDFVAVGEAILTEDDTRAYAEEIMNSEQRSEFDRELEINLSYTLGEEGRFRVNIFTQRGTVALVIRRIKTEIPKLENLGLPDLLGELILHDRGLLLVT